MFFQIASALEAKDLNLFEQNEVSAFKSFSFLIFQSIFYYHNTFNWDNNGSLSRREDLIYNKLRHAGVFKVLWFLISLR